MAYFMSVDAGGTKTAIIVTDEQGKLAARAQSGPGNFMTATVDQAVTSLRQGLKETGIDPGKLTSVFLGISGYGDEPQRSAQYDRQARDLFPAGKFGIGNDTYNALAGSLALHSGIHIIAGTGSNGIGLDRQGHIYTSGGWHHLLNGDEGSGYWLSIRLLQEFTKQADGRHARTQLYSYLMDKYHLKRPEGILDRFVHEGHTEQNEIAGLMKDVSLLAQQNDPAVVRLCRQAAEELNEIATAVWHQGDFGPHPLVSWSGGTITHCAILRDRFMELAFQAGMKPQKPICGPAAGGILLAMKQAGYTPDTAIIERLSTLSIG